jgi:hypothetical protein
MWTMRHLWMVSDLAMVQGPTERLSLPVRGKDLVWRRSMLSKAITAMAAAAIVFSAASTSVAKDGGPPTIDIQKTCRENVNALSTILGGRHERVSDGPASRS